MCEKVIVHVPKSDSVSNYVDYTPRFDGSYITDKNLKNFTSNRYKVTCKPCFNVRLVNHYFVFIEDSAKILQSCKT